VGECVFLSYKGYVGQFRQKQGMAIALLYMEQRMNNVNGKVIYRN
jgi:hypothetical protein